MIIGIEYVSLLVGDLAAGVRTYKELLGREPAMYSMEDGMRCAYFVLENCALRVISPSVGEHAGAVEDSSRFAPGEGKLVELAFAVSDADEVRRRFKRISLLPEKVREVRRRDVSNARPETVARTFRVDGRQSNSVQTSFEQPIAVLPRSGTISDGAILRADMVVLQTARPEHAIAFYGGKLDLELVFDRINEHSGTRLLQFGCGDMLLEVTHNPKATSSQQTDTIWGIGWRVHNAEATHRRLASLGPQVSPIKDGAKPGTRVFSVRDGTCGIPTLVIEHLSTHERI